MDQDAIESSLFDRLPRLSNIIQYPSGVPFLSGSAGDTRSILNFCNTNPYVIG